MNPQNAIIDVVAAVIFKKTSNGVKYLIAQRSLDQSGAGDWEFPGGKVESGEGFEEALKREILEELGVEIEIRKFILNLIVQYPKKKIRLHFYLSETTDENFKLSDHDQVYWATEFEFKKFKFSLGDQLFLEKFNQVNSFFQTQ